MEKEWDSVLIEGLLRDKLKHEERVYCETEGCKMGSYKGSFNRIDENGPMV